MVVTTIIFSIDKVKVTFKKKVKNTFYKVEEEKLYLYIVYNKHQSLKNEEVQNDILQD